MVDQTFDRTRRSANRGGFDAVRNIWQNFGTTQSPTYQAQPEGTFGPSRAINATLGDALLMALSGASGVAAGGAGLVGDTAGALGMRPDNADRLGRDLAAMAVEMPWNELAAFAPTLGAGGANAAVRGGKFAADEAGSVPTRWLTPADPDYTPVPMRHSDGTAGSGDWNPNQIKAPQPEGPVGRMNAPGQLDFDATINPPPPPPPPPQARRRGLFFSQAEQALLANAQAKGTVNQFRSQMLKAGVKPDELTWSGFDREFADPNRKVTRDELAAYFRDAPEPLTTRRLQAGGKTGDGPGFDEDDAFNSFWESESYDGTIRDEIRDEFLAKVENEAVPLGDLRESNPELYASLEAQYDDLDDDFLFYEGDIVRDADSYVSDFMDSDINSEFEDRVRQAWDDWGRDSEMQSYEDAGFFSPGGTVYSQNFTPGATNYREDLYQVNPETRNRAFGSYGPQDTYEAPHFSGNSTDLAFHTRAGEFETPGGRSSVYHLGEIQSDYGQKNRGNIRKVEDEKKLEDLMTEAYVRRAEADDLDTVMSEVVGETTLPRAAKSGFHGAGPGMRGNAIRDALTDPNLSRYDQQAILDAYARFPEGREVSPLQFARRPGDEAFDVGAEPWDPTVQSAPAVRRGRAWWADANRDPRVQLSFADLPTEELLDLERLDFTPEGTPMMSWPPSRTNNFSADELNLAPGSDAPMGYNDPAIKDYAATRAERNSAYYGTQSDEPALPLGYTPAQQELADLMAARGDLRSQANAAEVSYDDMRRGTVPAAPFVTSTEKFTDQALKRAFSEALEATPEGGRGYEFDYMTLGNPEMAEKMTYMPAEAAEKFYGKLVPGRMQKLLDQVAPGHKVEPIEIETGEGVQEVFAVRLTDELREAARKNGIPLYSVGGGMVVLGMAEAGDQAPGPQSGGT